MLSNFTILILTHFVSDWFFQLDKWGVNKMTNFKYLLYHCIQYSILFLPVLYFLKINLLWSVWIFVTHLAIDNYKFVTFWNKYVKRISKPLPNWFPVVQDQIIHILVLIPVSVLN